jgi:holo-[acyl-carrier protein] synthase
VPEPLVALSAHPSVVGLGVDLCDIERLRVAMARTQGMRNRIFTAAEQEYCERKRDPAERYAARFAAKEAVMKAMGIGLGGCAVNHIEVVRDERSGAPAVFLHDTAARVAAERGVAAWLLSLTHTAGLAQATAIALGEAASPPPTAPPNHPAPG